MVTDPLLIISTLEEIEVAINEMIDEVMDDKTMPKQYAFALGEVLARIGDALSLMRESELKTN